MLHRNGRSDDLSRIDNIKFQKRPVVSTMRPVVSAIQSWSSYIGNSTPKLMRVVQEFMAVVEFFNFLILTFLIETRYRANSLIITCSRYS